MLASAARSDAQEAHSAWRPEVSAELGIRRQGSESNGDKEPTGLARQAGITVHGPLLDGGRTRGQTRWREQLARVAELKTSSLEEQIALRTVSLALERSRLYKQGQVYQQHENRLQCLERAVKKIVARDAGRRSELVQAKKTLQEARLAYDLSQSNKQRVEFDLRRFVGDKLPRLEGLTILLRDTPLLKNPLAATQQASDLLALSANADASEAFVGAVRAERRPSVHWTLRQGVTNGVDRNRHWSAGVSVTIPIYNAGNRHAVDAAVARAQADKFRHQDALQERQTQLVELMQRAKNQTQRLSAVDEVLQSSQKLRRFTELQWTRLGKRTLFDVMAAERNHYGLRIDYVNTLHDRQQVNALLHSLVHGIQTWLLVEHAMPSDEPNKKRRTR